MQEQDRIIKINIEEEMKKSYIDQTLQKSRKNRRRSIG